MTDERLRLPTSESLGQDQLAAIDRAAHACGRLSSAIELSRSAVSEFLLIRHTVRVHDGTADLATELLLAGLADSPAQERSDEYDRTPPARHQSMADALVLAGLGELVTGRLRDTLDQTDAFDPRHTSAVFGAAIAAGAIITSAPSSPAAQRGAALAGALVLVRGGALAEPWLAPSRIDAAARSAAVQVDRAGEWSEWIRAWSVMLARETTTIERALHQAEVQLASERVTARDQRRVGATDVVVLKWLHAHSAFTIRGAVEALGLTAPTVGTAIERLEALGFATELTGRKRDRVWASSTLLGLTTLP